MRRILQPTAEYAPRRTTSQRIRNEESTKVEQTRSHDCYYGRRPRTKASLSDRDRLRLWRRPGLFRPDSTRNRRWIEEQVAEKQYASTGWRGRGGEVRETRQPQTTL